MHSKQSPLSQILSLDSPGVRIVAGLHWLCSKQFLFGKYLNGRLYQSSLLHHWQNLDMKWAFKLLRLNVDEHSHENLLAEAELWLTAQFKVKLFLVFILQSTLGALWFVDHYHFVLFIRETASRVRLLRIGANHRTWVCSTFADWTISMLRFHCVDKFWILSVNMDHFKLLLKLCEHCLTEVI